MHERIEHRVGQLSGSNLVHCNDVLYLWGLARHPRQQLTLVLVSDTLHLQAAEERRQKERGQQVTLRTLSFMWIELAQLPALLSWWAKRQSSGSEQMVCRLDSALRSHQLPSPRPSAPLLEVRGALDTALDFIGHVYQVKRLRSAYVRCGNAECGIAETHCHMRELIEALEKRQLTCPDTVLL